MRNTQFFTILLALFLCITSSFAQTHTLEATLNYCFTFSEENSVVIIPPNVNLTVEIEAWGAGGGSRNALNHRSGGGGGAYVITSYPVLGCESFSITVGQGAINEDGGNTSFNFGGGNIIVGGGERGGTGTGGSGGTGPGTTPGGDGGNRASMGAITNGGGGGGGSGPGNGPGSDGIGDIGGAGGVGTGSGGAGGDIGMLGVDGTTPGGGGGGKGTTLGGIQPGAAGGHGQVIVCVTGVTVVAPPNAGMDGAITICAGESVSLADLEAAITGEDSGGTWNMTSGGAGTYIYTVTGITPCVTDESEVVVTEDLPTTATFNAIPNQCAGDADPLPATSFEGFTGTWSPVFDPNATTTYTFTVDVGQCATDGSVMVTIDQPVTATFNAIPNQCAGEADPLPATSLEGFTGTWSPVFDPNATTTYTFTVDAGQCATDGSVMVTIDQPVTTTFNAIPNQCAGEADPLPATSIEGFTGTWSPVFDPNATTTYTFTVDAGQCASDGSVMVTIDQPTTTTFNAIPNQCAGEADPLPATSLEGFTGTWSPVFDPNATTTYTFTVDAGQCATDGSVMVTIDQPVTATFNAIPNQCAGEADPLPATSIEGFTGSWSPVFDPNVTTTYTFTVDAGQCATDGSVMVTIDQPVTATFNAIPNQCAGETDPLPATSVEGFTGIWSPVFDPNATTTYTFTVDPGQCAADGSVMVTIDQPTTATFNAIANQCAGEADPLPATSLEGFTGSWSPVFDPNATTTYTFTVDAGQCATDGSVMVTIDQPTTTTFNVIANQCAGEADPLPATSLEGFTGIWSPVFDPNATTTYTFTVDAGQCATDGSVMITIDQPVTATFNAIPNQCAGEADPLPATSLEGFTGTWSPVFDPNATTTYTFTVDAGQCASDGSVMITIDQPTTTTFNAIPNQCVGESDPLPATSLEGFTGIWSPIFDPNATTTYTFTVDAGQCASDGSVMVTIDQPVTATFNAITNQCAGEADPLPATSLEGFTGSWSPVFDPNATTTYTFTVDAGQCASDGSVMVTIDQPVTATFNAIPNQCAGEADPLPATSLEGFTGSWSPVFDPNATTTYTFTVDAGQCAADGSVMVTIDQPTTATFNAIPNQCAGEADPLPATSLEGFTGTWSPVFDPNATTTYTFTVDGGQCAIDGSVMVTIDQPVTATFNAIPNQCAGEADPLPATSIEGFTGTWSPVFDPNATTTYTFTVDGGQCATNGSLMVTIDQPVIATFNAIPNQCAGEADPLPATSIEGFTGTWSPVFDPNATTTYTFTVDGGQCATDGSVMITIDQPVTATFNAIPNQCAGEADPLPATSIEGFTGSWSPVFDPNATTTYTFTVDAVQCAIDGSVMVTIDQPVTATFNAIPNQCAGEADPLPVTSVEGFTGIWSPIFDPNATTTYTFTVDGGQCATDGSVMITIDQPVTATFNAIPNQCAGEADPLPATSIEGFTGTWSPVFDPNATTTYTFTVDAGQCATDGSVMVTIDQPITATFNAIPNQCAGEADPLPATSLEGFTGTWSPIFDPNATTTYTFTVDAGQCAIDGSVMVTIDQPTTATFNAIPNQCAGEADPLPATSLEGFTGTWSPVFDPNATTTYTFTVDAGQCAIDGSVMVTIDQPTTATFNAIPNQCAGESDPLPVTSLEGFTGTWSPVFDPNATTTYTFTVDAGQCATDGSVMVTIDQFIVPTFMQLGNYCENEIPDVLPLTSLNGIMGTWDGPIVTSTAGIITYNFTPDFGECATPTTMDIEVEVCDCANPPSVTVDMISPICETETLDLSAVLGGDATMVTWTTAGDGTFDDDMSLTPVYTPGTTDITNGTVTLMVISDDPDGTDPCEADDATIVLSINAQVEPMFTQLGTYCIDEVPDVLPLTSLNGILGTWDGPIVTSTAGIITYNFTPDFGECATPTTMDIEVEVCDCANPPTVMIDPIIPICENETLDLSAVIGGGATMVTWTTTGDGTFDDDMSLTPVYTLGATDIFNATVTLMVLTDDPDGTDPCEADDATIVLSINTLEEPMFTQLGTYCIDEVPDVLPLTSINGIMGTWDGPIVTSTAGIITYNFTPDLGECATPTTMDIEVEVCDCTNPPTVMIDAIMPICENETLDLTAVIGGDATMVTWTTAGDGTFDDDMSLTPVYTPGTTDITNGTVTLMVLTDDPDGTDPCEADNATIVLSINTLVTPMFTQLGTYCENEMPDVLPLTSLNGIIGTWDGPIVTSTAGIITYNFTPDFGECATPTTMDIEVEVCDCANPPSVTVDMISPICETETLDLSAVLGGDATMVTWTTAGDGTFDDAMSLTPVYTPGTTDITNGTVTLMVITDDPDGTDPCEADDATIVLSINAQVEPMFTQLGTYCIDEVPDVLPLTSLNGILGTWDGPIVTTTAGIITYNFTPDFGECATPTTMDIEVEVCDCANPPTVMIDPIIPICENETLDLSAVIGGGATMVTWTTTGDGTFDDDMSLTPVYTLGATDIFNATVTLMVLTDDPDGTDPCEADDATIVLSINTLEEPMFTQLGTYCIDEVPDVLPLTSINGIMGTWDGPIVTSTAGIITYNFTPDFGECATPTTMDIEVEVCDCVNPPSVMIDAIMPICENETLDLTAVLGGDATMVTWTTAGDGTFDDDMSLTPVYTPGTTDITNGTVTLMVITDDPDGTDPCEADEATIVVTINAQVEPMFTQLGSYCENEMPDVLPLTSMNGIMGTWDGPIVTSTAGIITYNFTPDFGECATPTTMDIEVEVCDCANPPSVTVDMISPICENETIDLSAVLGGDATMVTWTTAGDGTFDDNTSLTPIYTPGTTDITNGTVNLMVITDDPDGTDPCEADEATIVVTINAQVEPMFTQLGSYCENEMPDVLPLTSMNGIMGTWDGPIVTSTAGIITYNFTPDFGECAIPTTMDIEVEVCDCANPPSVTVDMISPICEDETIDLSAVLGGDATMVTWTTAGDGTFDDDMSLTPVYTPGTTDITNGTVTLMVITDDPDGTDPCEADEATIVLSINAQVEPMFTQLGSYCENEVPDVLPLTSTNGIMGTWDGPIVTSTAGIITYNFTPDFGECAIPTTMNIEVEVCDCANPPSVTVDMISPICEDETIDLSAVLGGDATMVTWTTAGDGTFDDDMSLTPVYTPGTTDITNGSVTLMVITDDPDGTDPCEADDATIVLSINTLVTPMFTQLGSYCENEVPDVLPLTSMNGIMGTWDGPIVTTTAGIITYNFTPDFGECATPTTMDIEVEVCDCANPPSVTVDMISPICENETLDLSAVLGGDATMVTWTTAGDGTFDDDMSLTPVYTPGTTDITNGTVTLMVITDDPDGTDPCEADEAIIVVTINAQVEPMFTQLGSYCENEVPDVLPLTSTNGIIGTWDGPIVTSTAGIITYNFTPDFGECATPTTMDIEVEVCDCANPPSVTVDMISPICEDETIDLTAVIGGDATMVTWTTAGDGTFDDDMSLTPVYTPGATDITNGTVTLMVITDDPDGTDPCEADEATIVVTINAQVEPMFTQLGSYCENEVPDVLPLTSTNGIMGTWDGPIVTSTAGIITYNFTPDFGECATPTTMDIEVEVCDCANPPSVMIDAIMSICENETLDLTAVLGGDATMVTWTTAGDGTFDNDMSLTPVYTPGTTDITNGTVTLMVLTDDPDGTDPCEADEATIVVTINAQVEPMFTQLGSYCENEVPDVLPLTSTNGIMGTWDGPIVTSTAGIITYNFTPDFGECAIPTTMDIEVEVCDCANPPSVMIDAIMPICENETLDLTAVIGGDATMVTWTTAGDGTFDDDMSLTPVYTPGTTDITNGTVTLMVITDDPDGTDPCEADDATIVLSINTLVTPMFMQLGSYCENEMPDVLPLTSTNGIMGTWDGPIVTTTAGIITYNFTPDFGECATPTTMDIEVEICDCANPPSVTVDMISPICGNETLDLKAVIGGDATMVTWTTAGDGIFDDDMSFTPIYTPGTTDITNGTVNIMVITDDPDGTDPCEADEATIVVTINAQVEPMFMQLGSYCENEMPDVLPLTSTNGIMGTWDGPIVTTTAGIITYNFTPNFGECATPTTMDIEVEVCDCANPPSVTVDMISPICENETIDLTAVIGGDATMVTWTSAGDGTFDDDMSLTPVYTPGTTDITNGTVNLMVITDDPDGTDPCEADDATIVVTINAQVEPMFTQLGTYCQNESPDVLPLTSTNGIMGTWDGPIVTSTAGTFTYNFTPDFGECATTTTMDIEVEICDCVNPPSVTVDMISPICGNETVDLTAIIGGDASMVTWTTAGDGTFDDDMSLTPVYTPGTTDITNGTVNLMVITDDPDGTDPCEAAIDNIDVIVTPLPTFLELEKNCHVDLESYFVTFQTDATDIIVSNGDITDNIDGTITISNIPKGENLIITLTLNNCITSMESIAPNCVADVILPNIFSPNNDGNNDVLYVNSNDVETVLSMRIYDRWGGLTFESINQTPSDPSNGWDGTFIGKPVNPGVFIYLIEVLFTNGKTKTILGDITVVR